MRQEAVLTIMELNFKCPMYTFIFLIFGVFIAILVSCGYILNQNIQVFEIVEPTIEVVPFLHEDITSSVLEPNTDKIENYLATNYKDYLINLTSVAQDLGLTERKVSALIKKRYNHSFRQHLNFLRIAEAKRLLHSPDLQIKEISYEIGYENQVHFLRVFKSVLGITPTEFRKFK